MKLFKNDPAVHRKLAGCLLILLVLWVYLPVKTLGFVNYKDPEYVSENPVVLVSKSTLSFQWAIRAVVCNLWHPVTIFSHMVDGSLFGQFAVGHHFTNLLLHLTNTLLLFLLLQKFTGHLWRSLVVAILFGIHPLNVETVAWISQRKNLLCVLFGLLAILRYHKRIVSPSKYGLLSVGLLHLAGLMSSPMLVTLPFVLLLLDFWPLKRISRGEMAGQPRVPVLRKVILEKLPLFVLSAIFCVLTLASHGSIPEMGQSEQFPLHLRLANAFHSYLEYLSKLILPTSLSVYYPHPGNGINIAMVIAGALVVVSGIFMSVRFFNRFPYLAIGWLMFLGTLVPVLGLVQIGGHAMADRYAYLSFIGLFILITLGAWDFQAAYPRLKPLVWIAGIIFIGACAGLSHQQVAVWKSSISLFNHALKTTPNNHVAMTKLGAAYLEEKEPAKAFEMITRSIEMRPTAEAYNHLGVLHKDQGDIGKAMELFGKSTSMDPQYPDAHNNLGSIYFSQGRQKEAIESFEKAITWKPFFPAAYLNYARALGKEKRFEDAFLFLDYALQMKPSYDEAHFIRGVLYEEMEEIEGAIRSYMAALTINPNNLKAVMNIGRIHFSQGNFMAAVTYFSHVLEIQPDNPEARDLLDKSIANLQSGTNFVPNSVPKPKLEIKVVH